MTQTSTQYPMGFAQRPYQHYPRHKKRNTNTMPDAPPPGCGQPIPQLSQFYSDTHEHLDLTDILLNGIAS